jgi:hypothetical protein
LEDTLQITLTQLAEIAEWPLYVTDEGRVSCNAPSCPDGTEDFTQHTSGRRIDLSEFLWALHTHATTDHTA